MTTTNLLMGCHCHISCYLCQQPQAPVCPHRIASSGPHHQIMWLRVPQDAVNPYVNYLHRSTYVICVWGSMSFLNQAAIGWLHWRLTVRKASDDNCWANSILGGTGKEIEKAVSFFFQLSSAILMDLSIGIGAVALFYGPSLILLYCMSVKSLFVWLRAPNFWPSFWKWQGRFKRKTGDWNYPGNSTVQFDPFQTFEGDGTEKGEKRTLPVILVLFPAAVIRW